MRAPSVAVVARSPLVAAVAVVAAVAASCAPAPLAIPAGCSPLYADHDCGLPYPSDFFTTDDATLPTGKRVHFADAAKLITDGGLSADVNDAWPADGFSRVTPIVWSFGVRTDPASVTGIFDDQAPTLQPGFHTALINARTGERVPHFIDVDPLAEADDREGLVMHPLVQLDERTRYVVAISGVKAKSGTLPVPEAFARMRDNNVGDDPVLKPLLARYETDVFAVTTKDGLDRKALQLAWDFTTGSDEHVMDDMLTARAVALASLAETPPVVTVDAVFEGSQAATILGAGAEDTFRLVRGTVTGPRIVESNGPGTLVHRGADGKVALNGTATFAYTAIIPVSAADNAPAQVLCFGHGFFGDRSEIEGPAIRSIASHTKMVAIAIDWQGMSVDDIGEVVANVGGAVSKSITFGDRVMQSMVNWMSLTNALKRGLFTEQAGFRKSANRLPIIDVKNAPLSFLGISQGHVLGGTQIALNADLERTVLMVGGAGFSTMMFRANPFERFLFLLKFTVKDPLDRQKLAAQMQGPFDRFDPATFAPYVVGADVPVGPPSGSDKRRLLQIMGVGDSQVPNVASELHARIMGIPLLTPAPGRAIFGLAQQPLPATTGLMIYDLGVDDSFYAQASTPPAENPVHEGVRRTPQALDQMAQFFHSGVIANPCNGACVLPIPASTP